MNLLLLDKEELHNNTAVLSGRRAEHIIKVLRLSPGDTIRVGMIDGPVGSATIKQVTGTEVMIDVDLTRDPPPTPDVELILALPRPIMLQRIIKQATVLGVRRFHLIRSQKVEKSFFNSPVLQPNKIHSLLVEGLEQAMDTRLPEVIVYPRFKPFVEDTVPTLGGTGLLAHPGTSSTLNDVAGKGLDRQRLLLAIGPEGGWNDFECECFLKQGFSMFTLGSRILHVDTAVIAMLAQVALLRDIWQC